MVDSDAGLDTADSRSVLHIMTVPSSLLFLQGQTAYLKARGWQVHVLSSAGAALDAFATSEHVSIHTAELTRAYTPFRDLRALLRCARVLRQVRPDIVHAHTPKAGLVGLLAARLVGGSLCIYQVRGLPFESMRGVQRALLRCCEWITCRLAHAVICDSSSLRDVVLRERLCRSEKCITLCGGIGNGVDAEGRFNPARVHGQTVRALRARFSIPAHAPVVGYVGRLARDKGLGELGQAWRRVSAQHPDAHLIILGAADGRAPADAATLQSLQSHPAVHFAGRVADPVPYYATLDVLALPTYREGLPNVILEAAAMRVPVVATRTTGCIDAVQHGVTGLLIAPRSAEALAGALELYLRHADLREQHGAAGRARMLARFRQPPLWAELERLYARLLRSRASRAAGAGKRVFDVVAASALLLSTAPLIAAAALLVRVTMGSPVIFRQVRAGAQGRAFTLHKFRTMNEARSADGTLLPGAERITRVGRWLRSTGLDELPQLWDVLRGRMSLVGPRPLLLDYLPRYNAEQARRQLVRPGLTGWAQINGRNDISWQEKFSLDAWYVEHASPGLDLRVLLRTIPTVLRPHDNTLMQPFHGN